MVETPKEGEEGKMDVLERLRQSNNPFIQYGIAIEDHRALGHQVYDTFWKSRCLDCKWKAHLTFTGEPFIPNRQGAFQLHIEEA